MHSIYCCHAIVFDQIQFLDLSSVSPFRTFSRVNLLRCIYECKTRLRCDVIKYSATRKECYLIIDSSVDTGERRPGIVSGRKSDWDMVNVGLLPLLNTPMRIILHFSGQNNYFHMGNC